MDFLQSSASGLAGRADAGSVRGGRVRARSVVLKIRLHERRGTIQQVVDGMTACSFVSNAQAILWRQSCL